MITCNALIWLTSIHLDVQNEDHINFFNDEDYAGIGVSCVCSLIAVILYWWFCVRILLQYYYKEKDMKWMSLTKWLAKIATAFWLLSMLAWIVTVLIADISDWTYKVGLALIPSWNKSLLIGVVYSIFYEFKASITRTQRVVRWIAVVTIFLLAYIVVISVFVLYIMSMLIFWGGAFIATLIFLSLVLTPFYNFFFVLLEELRPGFRFKCYMVCVPCCCGCFCSDQWMRFCVPQCCLGRPYVKTCTWLIIGMSFVWIVCTVFANNNECLAEASLIEYAYGFRTASILVLLFCVLINIELTYSGSVKDRFRNRNRNNEPAPIRLEPGQAGLDLAVGSNIRVVRNDTPVEDIDVDAIEPTTTVGNNDANEEPDHEDEEDLAVR
eukprot:CAMPEP_0202695432 /NCGR_PEP_ID=MMETSP1385-20130828/9028_1 /ASSEMBLY_ACC=CAM_ASM_000861 /TAXON_ID=933848 /ORGANISM="Elphidium margaritaceum" /LENGTH=380 /DNA_ID=CAMNT_0049351455 /DNA_START=101 /DNA_END=1246 /DNA_ORIENTATION=+